MTIKEGSILPKYIFLWKVYSFSLYVLLEWEFLEKLQFFRNCPTSNHPFWKSFFNFEVKVKFRYEYGLKMPFFINFLFYLLIVFYDFKTSWLRHFFFTLTLIQRSKFFINITVDILIIKNAFNFVIKDRKYKLRKNIGWTLKFKKSSFYDLKGHRYKVPKLRNILTFSLWHQHKKMYFP